MTHPQGAPRALRMLWDRRGAVLVKGARLGRSCRLRPVGNGRSLLALDYNTPWRQIDAMPLFRCLARTLQ